MYGRVIVIITFINCSQKSDHVIIGVSRISQTRVKGGAKVVPKGVPKGCHRGAKGPTGYIRIKH